MTVDTTDIVQPDDLMLCLERAFVSALAKAREAVLLLGFTDEWLHENWADYLRHDIRRHVDKGDPRDVIVYAAFALHHGWSLAWPDGSNTGGKAEE